MKMSKKITIGLLIVFSTMVAVAQSFDEERMNRDLKVAENILTTLISEGSSRSRLFNGVESNYIPDYGVIFTVPEGTYIYSASGKSIIYSGSNNNETYIIASDEGDKGKEKKKLSAEEWNKLVDEKHKEQITIFLVDYADLIGQLEPSHRIVVQTRSKDNFVTLDGRRKSKTSAISGQILKSDLNAYKQGKLNRDEVMDKISFTSEKDKEISKDLELFATIFSRLYEPDLSNTYYLASRSMSYTQLDGLGVTFNLKVYSSNSNNNGHTITTTGESGLTQEERNTRVNEMYPAFKQTFLENILDYGRTIRSLKPEEMLVFKVKLTECKGCEMPEEIEVIVKGETLRSYDKGSLSRDAGVKKINVKELGS